MMYIHGAKAQRRRYFYALWESGNGRKKHSGNGSKMCAAARTAPKARGMDLSSAALAVQQEFVDSRIMFSIGKAWIDMENNGIIWFGIPLSVTGKSKYYDR